MAPPVLLATLGQCLCLPSRVIEQSPVQLPWDLEDKILSRLAPRSLVRFKTVCKRWNALFNDKIFLTNHLSRSRPQFIFHTNSKIYSIDMVAPNSIDPTIELRELPSSDTIPFPYGDIMNYTTTTCDEFLFCKYHFWENETALWNPWLREVKWLKFETFFVSGFGYDNSRSDKVYKILGLFFKGKFPGDYQERVTIYECATNTFKFIDIPDEDVEEDFPIFGTVIRPNVSLNGNLYWVSQNLNTREYFILSFDFSREKFKPLCLLPCQKKGIYDQPILAVYKRDRFSLLKQCNETRKVEIWVTKENIDREEEEVGWINLMTLPTTNLPKLFLEPPNRISYFIYDKTIFMCCGDDETDVACIYIVREDLCKKIQIGSGIVKCCHCVYTPNFFSLPLYI